MTEKHAVAMKWVDELAAALRAVIAESDRNTDAYIRARALLAALASEARDSNQKEPQ